MSALPELLAPAGSPDALTAAIRCGADAVYLGGEQFSARAHAENFAGTALRDAILRCHACGVRVYPAVNTLIFDAEFPALDRLLLTLAEAGTDGVIVQDIGAAAYIRRRIPQMKLHASTQMTIHSPAGIRYAAAAGFCRVVLARELSAEQIAACVREAKNCSVETEVFVHGAHCMCVSGQCFLSAAMGGRSANRGCCAQPCRLPFSADEKHRDACALSLKDQSLLAHLAELAEIGVDSLKIEGRMKRPEYVAAAVTACRQALTGQRPDTDTLRAVFSRDGFTDGYYTGARREMFGTRRKEDVIAAQDVLGGLRQLYQNPRKCAVLDAHFELQNNQPAALTVTDEAGITVTVTGDVPQQAVSRPADLAQLRKQFEKLGDTIYSAGNITAEIAEGVMLPASALNALRRDAVTAMNAARAAAFAPPLTAAEVPEIPKKTAPVPDNTAFRLQIRRLSQLDALGDAAEKLGALYLPLALAADYAAGKCPVPIDRCMLLAPRFVTDEADVIKLLKNAKQLGFSHLACQHAADIALGAELDFTLHGTLGLHITNSLAAAEYAAAGLKDGLRSPELPAQTRISSPMPLGIAAYGRLPLMLTRNCPIQHEAGCAKCRHRLYDRKGAALYCDCTRISDAPDYAELFNSAPVWLADRSDLLKNHAFALLCMTDESPERAAEIVRAYLYGTPVQPPQPFTRGIKLQKDA